MLSTWHSNQHRRNDFLQTLWCEFNISTQAHFYHVGAREVNRQKKSMLEALVTNYPLTSPYGGTPKVKRAVTASLKVVVPPISHNKGRMTQPYGLQFALQRNVESDPT